MVLKKKLAQGTTRRLHQAHLSNTHLKNYSKKNELNVGALHWKYQNLIKYLTEQEKRWKT
jgi:hypothetical protein